MHSINKTIGNAITVKIIGYALFVFGYFWYCLSPLLFMDYFWGGIFQENSIGKNLANYFEEYSIYAAIYLFLFSLGYWVEIKKDSDSLGGKLPDNEIKYQIVVISLFYVVITLSIVDFTELTSLKGYMDGYDVTHRGQLTTLYLTAIWWYIYIDSNLEKSKLKSVFAIIMLLSGINLIALGSRLGLLTGVIGLAVNYFLKNYNQKSARSRIGYFSGLLLGIFFIFALVFIGIKRSGDELFLENLVFIFLAEPMFIFESVPSYLLNISSGPLRFPIDIITGAIASVPSVFFDNKISFFDEFVSISPEGVSGHGGVNHIIAILANFGYIGFPIYALAEGWFFGVMLRKSFKNHFYYTLGIMCASLLPFILFREGFQTLIKLVFFNFSVMPILMLFATRFLYRVLHVR